MLYIRTYVTPLGYKTSFMGAGERLEMSTLRDNHAWKVSLAWNTMTYQQKLIYMAATDMESDIST